MPPHWRERPRSFLELPQGHRLGILRRVCVKKPPGYRYTNQSDPNTTKVISPMMSEAYATNGINTRSRLSQRKNIVR